MAGEELFGQNLENPFAHLGLSKEAVQALNDLNDPEAIKTVVGGLYRAFSRTMHPDTGHKSTQRSEAFFTELVQAANDISSIDDSAVATYAVDFAKSKRQGRKTESAKPEVKPADRAPEIVSDLARAGLSELGLNFPLTSRIFINNYAEQYQEAYWASFRRTGDDVCVVAPYRRQDRPEEFVRESKRTTDNDPLVVKTLPWTEMLGRYYRPPGHFALGATIEVADGQAPVLRTGSGRQVEADMTALVQERGLEKPGFYEVRAKFMQEQDGAKLQEAYLLQSYYAPAREAEEFELRVLGSADAHFRSDLNHRLRNFTFGFQPAGVLANTYSPDLANKRLYTYADDLGHKIPENFYYLLGRYFTPRVLADNLLVTAADGEIYIPGRVTYIFH